MTQHTPGPWRHLWNGENIRAQLGSWHVFHGAKDGHLDRPIPLRRVKRNNATAEANARLIATAPELLAMLRKIDRRIDDCSGSPKFTATEEAEIAALIAKATGGSP